MDIVRITDRDFRRLVCQLDAGGLHTDIMSDILDELGHDACCDDLASMIGALVKLVGLEEAIRLFDLNEFNACVGPYVIRHDKTGMFFCKDYGWLADEDAATGYSAFNVVSHSAQIYLQDGAWHFKGRNDRSGSFTSDPFPSKELTAEAAIPVFGLASPTDVVGGSYILFESVQHSRFDIAA
jgi:hypothetical protein